MSDRHDRHLRPGFTLLELILVLVILAIVSALIVPSLSTFATGRGTNNGATLLLGLAGYARTAAVSEGRTYRMNFDTAGGNVWLTAADGGQWTEPANNYGKHAPLPTGVRMTVDVQSQPNVIPTASPDVVETAQPVTPPVGQAPTADQTTALQIAHDAGSYVEFLPSGRMDPVHVQLTDKQGRVVDVGSLSPTEAMHVLTAGEMK